MLSLSLALGVSLGGATAMAQSSANTAPRKPTIKLPKGKKSTLLRRLRTHQQKQEEQKKSSVSLPQACTIKTSDLIHKKIDIGAQVSLMRKLSGDFFSRREASSMYAAIDAGRLAGIFLPPRKAVSDRGASMSPPKGYWQLIPKGELSTCLKQPSGQPPMIVYRENLTKPQIDAALTHAWKQCGLLELPEPCDYIVDLHKPEVECNTDQDCITKKKGDFCNLDTHTCGVAFPDDILPGPTCTYPSCDPSVPAKVWPSCGTVGSEAVECLPKAGSQCGVCDNVSDASQQCHAANEARHKAENEKCRQENSPGKVGKYSLECVGHMLKCEGGSALSCGKAAKCFVSPQPYQEYKQCLNQESARYTKEGQRCRSL